MSHDTGEYNDINGTIVEIGIIMYCRGKIRMCKYLQWKVFGADNLVSGRGVNLLSTGSHVTNIFERS